MNFKKILMIPLLAAIPAITACGSDCKSLCEDEKKCADGNPSADCSDFCDKSESLADNAGCKSQYDDAVSCGSDMKDACSTTDHSCDAKASAFASCITPYCTNASHQSECVAAAANSPTKG